MRRPKRGEIYRLKSDKSGKARPVVIVSRDPLNGGHSVIAVPFNSRQLEKRKQQEWCAVFARNEGGLEKNCVAKTDEITLIDKLEIDFSKGPLGTLSDSQMQRIEDCLRWTLQLDTG